MTRDQAVAQVLIWAGPIGTLLLIALALAWGRAREIITACQCDTGREPRPAEIADAIACGCEDGDCFWCAARTGADRMPGPTKLPYVRGIPQADRYPEETS